MSGIQIPESNSESRILERLATLQALVEMLRADVLKLSKRLKKAKK